jgi:hypothetical protein
VTQHLDDVAHEDKFGGNAAAIRALIETLRDGEMVAFTGAGISVPLAPAWNPFLADLISYGLEEGFIPPLENKFLSSQIVEDPLELANTLEDLYTKPRFRSRIAGTFHLDNCATPAQELIVGLPFDSVVTLNYDDGLSTAFVQAKSRLPLIIRNDDTYELAKWQQGAHKSSPQLPIIHWHGNISSPDKIILTADDYNSFYSRPENTAIIAELWRSRSLLAIGFGFKDPFLTRIAESILRGISAGNSHFALIGHHETGEISAFVRKQFSRKYRLTPIFYPIKANSDGSEDHSALTELLQHLTNEVNGPPPAGATADPGDGSASADPAQDPTATAKTEFEKSLLVGSSEQTLYVEPRLYYPETLGNDDDGQEDEDGRRVAVTEVVSSAKNFIISSPFEHGASTLGRRIVYECILSGNEAVILDAGDLPDYKAKLMNVEAFKRRDGFKSRVLVLDNVNVGVHEKLLKEIVGLKTFDKYILLCKRFGEDGSNLSDIGLDVDFEPLTLAQMRREDIRTLANQLYDTYDSDMVAAAVEKTYTDLLDLCIPLTPSNIIMYISVIYREGSFVALNRLQIMDRYIRDLLQRPSDAYKDAFNIDNKIDLLSHFVFTLFNRHHSTFSRKDWDEFCDGEMARSLSFFDKTELLSDLVNSRIVIYADSLYIFRYRLFYSYLLGRYIGERPELIPSFVDDERHLAVDSLVETIAGTSKDNTYLVTSLIERLEKSISDFEATYKTAGLDPYAELEWALTDDEEEKVWKPVTERLANGPASDTEVDKVKRSILAEQKTDNQIVILRDFNKIESYVSFNQIMTITALRESANLDGALKVRASNAIFSAYQLVMRVGFLFSPIIATRRFFVWNNVAFLNDLTFSAEEQSDPMRRAGKVAGAIPYAIIDRAIGEMGSKKLGHVYKHIIQTSEPVGFEQLLLYSLLIRSKPDGWETEARLLITKLERRALYLRYMLNVTMQQFREEVNTNADRSALKRLVATVQAKRRLNKDKPTAKAVAGVLQKLENTSFFSGRKVRKIGGAGPDTDGL